MSLENLFRVFQQYDENNIEIKVYVNSLGKVLYYCTGQKIVKDNTKETVFVITEEGTIEERELINQNGLFQALKNIPQFNYVIDTIIL